MKAFFFIGAGAGEKNTEPVKNGPAPQHWVSHGYKNKNLLHIRNGKIYRKNVDRFECMKLNFNSVGCPVEKQKNYRSFATDKDTTKLQRF